MYKDMSVSECPPIFKISPNANRKPYLLSRRPWFSIGVGRCFKGRWALADARGTVAARCARDDLQPTSKILKKICIKICPHGRGTVALATLVIILWYFKIASWSTMGICPSPMKMRIFETFFSRRGFPLSDGQKLVLEKSRICPSLNQWAPSVLQNASSHFEVRWV